MRSVTERALHNLHRCTFFYEIEFKFRTTCYDQYFIQACLDFVYWNLYNFAISISTFRLFIRYVFIFSFINDNKAKMATGEVRVPFMWTY